MPPTAVVFALLAMVAWGLWAVLANLATQSLDPAVAMIVSDVTSAVAFYAGLEVGRTGVVTTISALYFVVAVVWSWRSARPWPGTTPSASSLRSRRSWSCRTDGPGGPAGRSG